MEVLLQLHPGADDCCNLGGTGRSDLQSSSNKALRGQHHPAKMVGRHVLLKDCVPAVQVVTEGAGYMAVLVEVGS